MDPDPHSQSDGDVDDNSSIDSFGLGWTHPNKRSDNVWRLWKRSETCGGPGSVVVRQKYVWTWKSYANFFLIDFGSPGPTLSESTGCTQGHPWAFWDIQDGVQDGCHPCKNRWSISQKLSFLEYMFVLQTDRKPYLISLSPKFQGRQSWFGKYR